MRKTRTCRHSRAIVSGVFLSPILSAYGFTPLRQHQQLRSSLSFHGARVTRLWDTSQVTEGWDSPDNLNPMGESIQDMDAITEQLRSVEREIARLEALEKSASAVITDVREENEAAQTRQTEQLQPPNDRSHDDNGYASGTHSAGEPVLPTPVAEALGAPLGSTAISNDSPPTPQIVPKVKEKVIRPDSQPSDMRAMTSHDPAIDKPRAHVEQQIAASPPTVVADIAKSAAFDIDPTLNDPIPADLADIPHLASWKQNSDGTISGIVQHKGKQDFPLHAEILTGSVRNQASENSVVTTEFGGRYYLLHSRKLVMENGVAKSEACAVSREIDSSREEKERTLQGPETPATFTTPDVTLSASQSRQEQTGPVGVVGAREISVSQKLGGQLYSEPPRKPVVSGQENYSRSENRQNSLSSERVEMYDDQEQSIRNPLLSAPVEPPIGMDRPLSHDEGSEESANRNQNSQLSSLQELADALQQQIAEQTFASNSVEQAPSHERSDLPLETHKQLQDIHAQNHHHLPQQVEASTDISTNTLHNRQQCTASQREQSDDLHGLRQEEVNRLENAFGVASAPHGPVRNGGGLEAPLPTEPYDKQDGHSPTAQHGQQLTTLQIEKTGPSHAPPREQTDGAVETRARRAEVEHQNQQRQQMTPVKGQSPHRHLPDEFEERDVGLTAFEEQQQRTKKLKDIEKSLIEISNGFGDYKESIAGLLELAQAEMAKSMEAEVPTSKSADPSPIDLARIPHVTSWKQNPDGSISGTFHADNFGNFLKSVVEPLYAAKDEAGRDADLAQPRPTMHTVQETTNMSPVSMGQAPKVEAYHSPGSEMLRRAPQYREGPQHVVQPFEQPAAPSSHTGSRVQYPVMPLQNSGTVTHYNARPIATPPNAMKSVQADIMNPGEISGILNRSMRNG